jgi:hypothetical protein
MRVEEVGELAEAGDVQGDELFLLGLGAQDGGVKGDLVDEDTDGVETVRALDLAPPAGFQPGIAVVHDALETAEGDDGLVDVGT